MSTYATDTFAGDGSTVEFTITFDYISRDHVEVFRVANSDGAETKLSVITTGSPTGDQYIWESDNKIKVGTAPTTAQKLKVQRDTPENQQIVDWSDGSYLIAEDLNDSDLQWLYNIQELEDKFAALETTAIKYRGAIDLTVDAAPASPEGGDFFINTGNGTVVASWTGIAGDAVVGAEQVIFNNTSNQWEIFQTPSSQTGVIEVKVTAPITRDVTDPQRPDIGIDTNTSLRVASNKLEITPRTLWGQTYNGTGNVSGNISGVPILGNAGTLQITTSDEGKIQLFPDNSQGAPNLVECSGAFELWPSKRLALEADSGSKKVYFCPPATLANDTHYTWPNAQPASAGQVLAVSSVSNTGFTILEWVDASSATTTVVAPTAPSTSEAGQLWLNTTDNRLYAAATAASSNPLWRIVAPMPIGATPPASPSEGDQYWDTDTARAYVYIAGTTNAWVDQNPGGGGGGTTTGGSDDLVFQENEMVCTSSYTLTAGRSALSAGPITINDTVEIEIPNNQTWVIL